MPIPPDMFKNEIHWLDEASPCNNIVVTSRARYARNLADQPFTPHGHPRAHEEVHRALLDAIGRNDYFEDFFRLDLEGTSGPERALLKELRLISKEMERGGENRSVYLHPELKCSVMVNEEDHLRMQCLEPGLQLGKAHQLLDHIDQEIAKVVPYAWHDRFGYLTACPTNVGTGLRASVMLHLPALTMRRQVEQAMKGLSSRGLTLRGFHGENTEPTGDFYQLSNEVTLGVSVDDIFESLTETVTEVMEKERETRSQLLRRERVSVEDAVWRNFGILKYARKISSAEAMRMLSSLRLGIDEGLFPGLPHETLNRLIMEIQPGHLIYRHGAGDEAESRDETRARLIQKHLPQL